MAELEQVLQHAGLMAGLPVPTQKVKARMAAQEVKARMAGPPSTGGKGKDGSTAKTGGKGKDGSRGGAKTQQGRAKKGAERQAPVVTVLSSLQQPQPSSAMLCEISR